MACNLSAYILHNRDSKVRPNSSKMFTIRFALFTKRLSDKQTENTKRMRNFCSVIYQMPSNESSIRLYKLLEKASESNQSDEISR